MRTARPSAVRASMPRAAPASTITLSTLVRTRMRAPASYASCSHVLTTLRFAPSRQPNPQRPQSIPWSHVGPTLRMIGSTWKPSARIPRSSTASFDPAALCSALTPKRSITARVDDS
jgi:hypothetical protein